MVARFIKVQLDYGVEIIEGVPGSGKSFVAVQRLVEVISTLRRPVYTNLPIALGTLRAKLRKLGGRKLVNLIQPLTREMFERFIDRYAQRARIIEDCRAHGIRDQDEVERRIADALGVNDCSGPDGNWIPASAVIVLDEVQNWYPMREQQRENPNLLKFLSMHRHGFYWIWCITQERGRISNSIRNMFGKLWQVRNLADDKLMWGIRFKHLGLKGFGYSCWLREQIEGRTLDAADPIANYVTLPWLPWHQWVFRCYESFSHVGGAEVARAQLEAARAAAGLGADGAAGEVEVPKVVSKGVDMSMAKVAGAAVLALCVGSCGGFMLGRVGRPAAVAVAGSGGASFPAFSGLGADYAIFDGVKRKAGDRFGEWTLFEVDRKGGGVLLIGRELLWMWRYGEPEPRALGRPELVFAALGAGRPIAGGSGVPGGGGGAGEVVKPAAGNGPGQGPAVGSGGG